MREPKVTFSFYREDGQVEARMAFYKDDELQAMVSVKPQADEPTQEDYADLFYLMGLELDQ